MSGGIALRSSWLIGVVLLGLLALPAGAAAAGTGGVSLKVLGLPGGERATVALEGPRAGGKGRVTRRVSLARARTLSGLPVGSYRVTIAKVRIRHRHGTIKRGAVASPVRRRHRLKVRSGRVAKVDVTYGTIVNPGVRSVSGDILQVVGEPADPTEVVLSGRPPRRGTILSARPSAALPNGLLVRVIAARRVGDRARATVEPAGIYEVAPNMSLDVPLEPTSAAAASALAKCGPSGSSLSPYARVSDIRLTGGWSTARVLFAEVPVGVTVEVHFKASAGIDVTAGGAFSCSLSLPAIAVQGMAGPIPVYGGIRPTASGQIAAEGKVHTEGSTDVTFGTSASVSGGAKPILSFGSPRFSYSSEVFTGVKAGVGLNAELGIGAANAANVHLEVGNSLDFSASPGQCTWDLNLGSFGVGGKIGPISIAGPSSPPLYHRNLWKRDCGPGVQPPAPPAPPPPPPPGPLTRATMSWDTDADIDLYAWDSRGNVLYYGERFGIPGAELIEDVIPGAGEFNHSSELFRETAEFNRPYTFGICDYRGDGADVTLTVVDPGGGTRVFQETLYFEGDGVVITSSPAGPDYSPPGQWCHYAEDDF